MARDIYQEITDKVIERLETGAAPWVRPWDASGTSGAAAFGIPQNWATGRAYRGANVLLLWMSGYADQRWLTYKQAQAVGAQVRKGEKGTQVILFKPWSVKDVNAKGETEERSIPVIRSFTVFNVDQIDGLPAKGEPAEPITKEEAALRYEEAARVFSQAKCTHGGDRAAYSPLADRILMPVLEAFESEEAYWGTALHELTHWSGHETRCDRSVLNRFGTEAYAREELVAELGAAFLCGSLGIPYTTRHADYIASWIKVLQGDRKAIVQAASLAQKAADYLNPQAVTEEQEEAEQAA